jgi:hypothetical protein
VGQIYQVETPVEEEQLSNGAFACVCIISFIIPFVGLILFCYFMQNKKKAAKSCLIAAGCGLVFGIIRAVVP